MSLELCLLCRRALTEPLERAGASYRVTCATCGSFFAETRDIESRVFEDLDIQPLLYRISALAKASKVPAQAHRRLSVTDVED